jgi:hypothetical protein
MMEQMKGAAFSAEELARRFIGFYAMHLNFISSRSGALSPLPTLEPAQRRRRGEELTPGQRLYKADGKAS